MQKRIVESDHLEQVCNQKRPRSQSDHPPWDDEVEKARNGYLWYPTYPYYHVETDEDENKFMTIPKIGKFFDEEPWSISVASIYVDSRRYSPPHKINDQRAEHVTRVSNAVVIVWFYNFYQFQPYQL